jgi:hypothetical protein
MRDRKNARNNWNITDKLRDRNNKRQIYEETSKESAREEKRKRRKKKVSGRKLFNSGRILSTQQYVIPNPSVIDDFAR